MNKVLTSKLNSALQGERAAVETYRQALSQIENDPRAEEIRTIHNDHIHAVKELSRNISLRKDQPAQTSGAWGSFAKTVMGTAKLFGDKAALKVLKEGEEYGLKQYKGIATDDSVDLSIKSFVSNKMIPQQQAHIRKLNMMMNRL